jgi:hypothetical protein
MKAAIPEPVLFSVEELAGLAGKRITEYAIS